MRATYALRVGTVGNDGNALAFYAQAMGFFKKHGVDVDIQVLRSGGAATVISAIVGKALEAGEADLVNAAAAYESSSRRRTHRSTRPRISTAKRSGWRRSTAWAGCSPPSGSPTTAPIGEPNVTAAGDEIRILASTYAAVGNHVQATAWVASSEWVKANPEAAKRFVAALHDAAVWGDNPRNHAQSAAILQKWLPFPEGLAERMHRAYYGQAFDVAAMQPLLDFAYAQTSLTSRVMARDLISPVALVR